MFSYLLLGEHQSSLHMSEVVVSSSSCAGRPKLPDGFEGGTWDKLKNAVVAVQNAQAVGTSLEELYQV